MFVPTHCLTSKTQGGKARELKTPCKVSAAFDVNSTPPGQEPAAVDFEAVWDTGATNSAINQRVVDACGLKPITMARVQYGGGEEIAEVYRIHIVLMGTLRIASVRVTKGKFSNPDVLIGMDVITLGDFSITNENNGTIFTFRAPSQHTLDFVELHKNIAAKANSRKSGPGGFPGGHQKGRRHGKGRR